MEAGDSNAKLGRRGTKRGYWKIFLKFLN
jgi:hypothetical protein